MNKSLVFGLAAVACWSTVATAFKLGLQALSPLPLVFWSVSAGCVCLVLICYKKNLSLWQTFKKHPSRFFIAGALTPGCYYPLLFLAYDLLPAQQAQSISYSWTLMLTIMSWLFFKEKMAKSDWLYCAIGYSGVLIIASGGNLDFMQLKSPIGLIIAMLSTLFFAGYWVLLRPVKTSPLASLTLCFISGWLVLLAMMVASGETLTLPSGQALLASGYIGLVEMALGYSCWLVALQMTKCTAKLGNLMYLSPVISFLLISQILGEPILPATIIGLVIILGSVFLQNKKPRTAKQKEILMLEPVVVEQATKPQIFKSTDFKKAA